MSNVESQEDPLRHYEHKSLRKQLFCAFVINFVSLLQGASVSTSSIILHNLQQDESEMDISGTNHNSSNHIRNITNEENATTSFQFKDFSVSKESGSWIGKKSLIANTYTLS